jgi:hypothetical protein
VFVSQCVGGCFRYSCQHDTDMRKDWLERVKRRLPNISGWRPISTAPCNQELELRTNDSGQTVVLEYPCLQTNEGIWINVDLGTEVSIDPVEWRAWHHKKSPVAHHAKIRPADRPAVTHPDHGKVKRDKGSLRKD